MKPGQRVIFLGHREWRGGKLEGYEGRIVTEYYRVLGYGPHHCPLAYNVRLPWLVRTIKAHPAIVCPVYNDCETCGYGAWGSVNVGTDKAPEIHHYCAWHLTTERDKLAA